MSGFASPNYTQTPNDFFTMLPEMFESELRVTLVMIRQTFGFHRDGFKMGVSKLAKAAGLSRQGALDGAELAEKRGTFRRTNPDAQTEAEWELVTIDPLQPVDNPLQPVEGVPLVSGGQVGIKEIINKELNNRGGLSEKDLKQANEKVTAMIENTRKVKYANREKLEFSEDYLKYSDLYVELCGKDQDGVYVQVPTKRVIQDWMQTFEEWKQENLKPEHIRAAYEYATREGGFPVGRPGSLTNTAVAMKTKMAVKQPVAAKEESADEHNRRALLKAQQLLGVTTR